MNLRGRCDGEGIWGGVVDGRRGENDINIVGVLMYNIIKITVT